MIARPEIELRGTIYLSDCSRSSANDLKEYTIRPIVYPVRLAILILAFRILLPATSIVAIRTQNNLVVAADSKTSYSDGRAHGQMCKITQVDKFFFVAGAGLLQVLESSYDLPGIARRAFSQTGDLSSKMNLFEQSMEAQLPGAFKSLGPRESAGFLNTQIILFGLNNGLPVLYLRVWIPVRGYNGTVDGVRLLVKIDCPPECRPDGYLLRVGEAGAIDAFMKAHPDFLTKQAMGDSARRLVQLEIDAEPDVVGPPIDILHLFPNRATWIDPDASSKCWTH